MWRGRGISTKEGVWLVIKMWLVYQVFHRVFVFFFALYMNTYLHSWTERQVNAFAAVREDFINLWLPALAGLVFAILVPSIINAPFENFGRPLWRSFFIAIAIMAYLAGFILFATLFKMSA